MQSKFLKFWKSIASDEKFDKSSKLAKDLKQGDIIAADRDIIVSVEKYQGRIFAKGRNYIHQFDPNDMVELFDTRKSFQDNPGGERNRADNTGGNYENSEQRLVDPFDSGANNEHGVTTKSRGLVSVEVSYEEPKDGKSKKVWLDVGRDLSDSEAKSKAREKLARSGIKTFSILSVEGLDDKAEKKYEIIQENDGGFAIIDENRTVVGGASGFASREEAQKYMDTKLNKSTIEKPGESTHSPKWDKCVEHVKNDNPGADPYAVCTASLGEESFKSVSDNLTPRDIANIKKEIFKQVLSGKPHAINE